MGRLCFVETLKGVGLQSTESTKGEIRVQKGCGGMPDVDCDYWNCSYCNYWNDGEKGNTDVQNDSANINIDLKQAEKADTNDSQSQKYEEKEVKASKVEDIRDLYLKEMQEFLGEEAEDLSCNNANEPIVDANPKSSKLPKRKTNAPAVIENEENGDKTMSNDSLVKYGEPKNISKLGNSGNENSEKENKKLSKHKQEDPGKAGTSEIEEQVDKQKEIVYPRYVTSFDSSTVKYETFTYTNDDVIELDAKLHQFLKHLKTADPKEKSSMEALGEAKENVRKSHEEQSETRKELNDNFVGQLQNRLDDSMKYDKDANTPELNKDLSDLDDQDESKLSLIEKLSMLEKIQNSILEEHDSFVGDGTKEDKVEQWLENRPYSSSGEKKPIMTLTPRTQGQTPWEVVENDTISDLSETFASVVSIKNCYNFTTPSDKFSFGI